MKVFWYIILLFINNSFENKDHSFITGIWEGKESIHIKVSELSIDKWIDVDFEVIFGANKTFEIKTGNLLYDMALEDYRYKNKLNFDSYSISQDTIEDQFVLKLFNKGTKREFSHLIKKSNMNEVVLSVKLKNSKNKEIQLKRIK